MFLLRVFEHSHLNVDRSPCPMPRVSPGPHMGRTMSRVRCNPISGMYQIHKHQLHHIMARKHAQWFYPCLVIKVDSEVDTTISVESHKAPGLLVRGYGLQKLESVSKCEIVPHLLNLDAFYLLHRDVLGTDWIVLETRVSGICSRKRSAKLCAYLIQPLLAEAGADESLGLMQTPSSRLR